MTKQKAHSSIGGSSIYRIAACPGSRALCETLPSVETSEYAKRGTAAHKLAEDLLRGTANFPPAPDVWSAEELESVNIYVNYVRSLSGKKYIEHKFNLSHIHPDAFGTADAVVWDEKTKTLHIIDYKHGAGVYVEAENNLQAQFYALGAAQDSKADKIVVTIVQPRCQRLDGEALETKGIRIWEIDPLHLFDFEQQLKEIYRKAFELDAPLNSGSHCRFCPAHQVDNNGDLFCPALRSNQEIAIKEAFSNLSSSVSSDQLSEYLSMCDQVEQWIKLLRAKALDKLSKGEDVPGWKLVAKRATRKWKPKAEEALNEIFNSEPHLMSIDVYEPKKLKSPAQLEKVLNKKQKIIITEFIISESSGATLAPVADKRPALEAKDAFISIEMDGE